MRIVLLTTLVPSGPPSGGVYVTLELTRVLSLYGSLELWAVWDLTGGTSDGSEWRGAIPISLGGLRSHGVVRSATRRLPLSVGRFYRADFAAHLRRAEPADLLVLDHVAMWQYVGAIAARRTLISSYNVEAEIYERAIALEPSWPKRLVWRYEWRTMRQYEGTALRRADRVLCLGTRDAQLMHDRYRVDSEVWYPSVTGARPVGDKVGRGVQVGSVGTMTWQANRWGMDWFIREVWPLVLQRSPEARLRLAGRGSEELPYSSIRGVERLGMVSDLQTFYEGLDVVVAPILGGAGIKIKVMDAAARGLPLVTTSSGVEGFGSQFPSNIRVADSADGFADDVCFFLESRPELPVREGIAWYERLVQGGTEAIARVIHH